MSQQSNSYSAPYITAMIYEIFKKNNRINIYDIIKELKSEKIINNIKDFEKKNNSEFLEHINNINKNKECRNIDIPIIGIYTKPKIDDRYIINLNNLFRQEGYNSIFFNDDVNANISLNKIITYLLNITHVI